MKRLLARAIRKGAERKLRVDCEYLADMGETSLRGLFKLLLVLPVSGHHRRRTRELVHAARIVAARHEDCGPCVQIAVHLARDDGMGSETAAAIVARRRDALSAEIGLVVDFAEAVLVHDASLPELRERVEASLGHETLMELSLAIAVGRLFPTLKRGLGHSASCSVAPVVA